MGGAPPAGITQPGGPGVYAVGHGGPPYTPLAQAAGVYGIGGAGDAPGIVGQGGTAIADGVHGFTVSGTGVSGESGNGVGVRATSSSSTGLVAIGTTGLFASSSAVGGTAGEFTGNVSVVNGNVTVTGGNVTATSGTQSVAVAFPDGSNRRLYSVGSPENWFEDFGFGELVNGQAHVQLDGGFSSVVISDAYHVFITEYDGNNALYVTTRTGTGFVVRAKESKANGTFSYRVVAKRKDIAAPRFDKVDLPSGAK